MSDDKNANPADLNALAAEALDLWQSHLAAYAADPRAKAELMRLMEPSRRLFAEWAVMMQHGLHGTHAFSQQGPAGRAGSREAGATRGHKAGTRETAAASGTHSAAAPGTAPFGPASDDGAFGVAQLTDHMARLEKHIAELEKRLAGFEPGAGKAASASPHAPRGKGTKS